MLVLGALIKDWLTTDFLNKPQIEEFAVEEFVA